MGPSDAMVHPVTINFHPDRYTADNVPLLLAIAHDGLWSSQFETGTGNGGLTAYKGGERWLWEQRGFDGAYDDSPVNLRPKFGALNFRGYKLAHHHVLVLQTFSRHHIEKKIE